MTRTAIYVRQSLDRTGEGTAVSRQLEDCRTLVAERGWGDAIEYVDNDTSATASKPRPQWQRLLADIEAGRVSHLVCWHTDRLYRRLRDLVDLVELAEQRSLKIVSVKSADLDLETPAGRMLAGMLGSAARYEAEQKGARQVRANRQRAAAGTVLWTRRPFGYDRDGDTITVVPDEATALQKAARAVLAGRTVGSVARDLNTDGVTTTTGGTWSTTVLKRVLLNPRYSGRAVYRGEDFGRGRWPIILSPKLQARLEETLTDPARRVQAGTEAKYLLSGMARCGRCGAAMYASPAGTKDQRWMVYRCRTSHLMRRLDLVDEVVEGIVLERLARPDALDLISPDVDLDRLRAEAVSIRERRDGLADLLADGLLPAAKVREQAHRLTERLREVETAIKDATHDHPAAALVGRVDVAQAWESLPLLARRQVVASLMTVTIAPAGKGTRFDPDSIEVEWVRP